MPAADQRPPDLLLSTPKPNARIEVASGGDTGRIVQEFRDAGYRSGSCEATPALSRSASGSRVR